ncbi:hypothetical protein [Paraburkholderia strydomiana]|uniref:hypothetical protein n=1 Tax=Paraburkholderia strydomiana TaxID=1245417 RepID=UPI001BEA4EC7|nr:hypothetical protein [Paraburkholderia strydomiana]MBT2794737.1 hypothetical protein [Paraburkholderia strydomiana]
MTLLTTREVCEAALAHGIKDKAEAAYARGDLFVKRAALMSDWENFVANVNLASALQPSSDVLSAFTMVTSPRPSRGQSLKVDKRRFEH